MHAPVWLRLTVLYAHPRACIPSFVCSHVFGAVQNEQNQAVGQIVGCYVTTERSDNNKPWAKATGNKSCTVEIEFESTKLSFNGFEVSCVCARQHSKKSATPLQHTRICRV
jgi:hypothetical protein